MKSKYTITLLSITIVIIGTLFLGGCNMFFDDSAKIIDKSFYQIVESIRNQDKEALKDMFSEKAWKENDDISNDIDYLFDFIHGEIESWERTGGPGVFDGNNDDGSGRIWKEIRATYDIKTSEQEYHVSIQIITKHSRIPSLVGLSSICIINVNDWDEDYNYWGCLGLPEDFEIRGIVVDKR